MGELADNPTNGEKRVYACHTLEQARASRLQLGRDFIEGTISSDAYVEALLRLDEAIERFEARRPR